MARPRTAPGQLGSVSYEHRSPTTVRARTRIRNGAGELVVIRAVGATEAEARRLLEERARGIWGGFYIEVTPATTVDELAAIWLSSARVQSLQQSSIEIYETTVRTILSPRIGAVPVSTLTVGFLSHFIDALLLERTPAYAKSARKALSLMLHVAVKHGALVSNPIRELERIPNSKRSFMALDLEQVPLVLALMSQWRGSNPDRRGGARPNTRVMIDTALITLGTSSRPGEALGLTRSDVRFTKTGAMQMKIAGTVSQTKKHGTIRKDRAKGGERQHRWITVPDFTAEVLRRLLAEYVPNENELLITSKNGTPHAVTYLSKLYRAFREANEAELRAIGIDEVELLTPKTFRKTAATALEGGADIDLVRRFLGHSVVATTRDHYLPVEDLVPAVTADVLNRSFAGLGDIGALRIGATVNPSPGS